MQGAVVLRLLSAQDACRIVYDDIMILVNESSVPVSSAIDRTVTDLNTAVAINVLANDTIYYNDTLDFCSQNAIITVPVHGTRQVSADGSILYTPQIGYAGVQMADFFNIRFVRSIRLTAVGAAIAIRKDGQCLGVCDHKPHTDCVIPNAFSPNGDGVNDAFVIECGKDWKLTVFNSWGIELFRDEDYHNDWEGTYKGAPIPDGTYFYSLKYTTETNETVEKAGFICLHR